MTDVTVTPQGLREAAAQLHTFFRDDVSIGGLSVAQAGLAFRLLASIMEEPVMERGLDAMLKELAGEKTELLRLLIMARRQNEHMLATINQLYREVRDEQERYARGESE